MAIENIVSNAIDPRSSIVQSVIDCFLSGVFMQMSIFELVSVAEQAGWSFTQSQTFYATWPTCAIPHLVTLNFRLCEQSRLFRDRVTL